MRNKLTLLLTFTLTLLISGKGFSQSPPSFCDPCLFYSGDLPDGEGAVGWPNENAHYSDPIKSSIYVPLHVPAGEQWQVTGVVGLELFSDGGLLDPDTIIWSIRTDMSPGQPGKVVASGKTAPVLMATGRGIPSASVWEYSVSVTLPQTVSLYASHEYWINVTPQCYNRKDYICALAQFYQSDTDGTNAYPYPAPTGDAGNQFINSPTYGYDFENLCDIGYPCYFSSIALVGTMLQQSGDEDMRHPPHGVSP
jgi:hypothetical protein